MTADENIGENKKDESKKDESNKETYVIRVSVGEAIVDRKIESCLAIDNELVFLFKKHRVWVVRKIPDKNRLHNDFVGLYWLYFLKHDLTLDVKVTLMALRKFLYLISGLDILLKVRNKNNKVEIREELQKHDIIWKENNTDLSLIKDISKNMTIDQFEITTNEFGSIKCPTRAEVEAWKNIYFSSTVKELELPMIK